MFLFLLKMYRGRGLRKNGQCHWFCSSLTASNSANLSFPEYPVSVFGRDEDLLFYFLVLWLSRCKYSWHSIGGKFFSDLMGMAIWQCHFARQTCISKLPIKLITLDRWIMSWLRNDIDFIILWHDNVKRNCGFLEHNRL